MVTDDRARKFEFIAGNLALDFANTVHNVGHDNPRDDLETTRDLIDWGRQAGIVGQQQVVFRGAELASFKSLRETIYELFSAVAEGRKPGPATLESFSRHLRVALGEAAIQNKDSRYRLVSQSTSAADRMRFQITQAAADMLLSGRLDRIRQCAGLECSWLFLDTSRNGTRRWCEMQACGNREKIRRFRLRTE